MNLYDAADPIDTITSYDNGLDYPLLLKVSCFVAVMILTGLTAVVIMLKKRLK